MKCHFFRTHFYR